MEEMVGRCERIRQETRCHASASLSTFREHIVDIGHGRDWPPRCSSESRSREALK